MPKDKGFKRIVREQAAASGRPYTAVRAELDRSADDVIPGWSFIGNIVLSCPGGIWKEDEQRMEGEPRQLGGFYADLLGMRIIRDDWVKVGTDRSRYPQLAIDGGFAPIRWPDPDHPQQMHMDITVPDLDAAEHQVLAQGAKRLQDAGDFRTFADPFGHPFCLYGGEQRRIARVVIDCFSPRTLATFYERLLGMRRVEDSPTLVVSSKDEHPDAPLLAFQHSPAYVPPRWPEPCGCGWGSPEVPEGHERRPQQVHLDLWFENARSARTVAERLGAMRTHDDRVYVDPAGHPFCILAPNQ